MITIEKLYEEDDLVVISKPIGIAAHKGADRISYTVSDYLVDEYPETKRLGWKTKDRIGIVHRLDKDTSGVMILAKKPEMIDLLQDQFRHREVEKHYLTLVFGKPPFESGTINAKSYRDPKNRRGQKVELVDFGLYNFARKYSATVYKIVKGYLMDNILIVIISLFLGGIAMILIEKNYIRKNKYTHPEFDKKLASKQEKGLDIKEITYKKAFSLGLWQSVAMIPGVSRSGATIIGGLLMNLKRETIVKFSFLLAIPTMLGASVLDLYKSYHLFSSADFLNIGIGFVISFIFALIFIKWLLGYVQKHNFIPFGWYRIILALVFFIVFFVI